METTFLDISSGFLTRESTDAVRYTVLS
jgi:hypothetical protein